jgi:hypothetical protein
VSFLLRERAGRASPVTEPAQRPVRISFKSTICVRVLTTVPPDEERPANAGAVAMYLSVAGEQLS